MRETRSKPFETPMAEMLVDLSTTKGQDKTARGNQLWGCRFTDPHPKSSLPGME